VRKGDRLGTITDPMSNAQTEVRSPYSGRIIGMARNQVVMPGFAAFHVGIQTNDLTNAEQTEDLAQKTDSGGYVDGMSE
jgi:dihydroorotase-like cyclic amidohydrolase